MSFTVPTSGAVYNSTSLRRLLLEVPKGKSGALLDFDAPLCDAIGGSYPMCPGGQSHIFIPSRLSQVIAECPSPGTISESLLRCVSRVVARCYVILHGLQRMKSMPSVCGCSCVAECLRPAAPLPGLIDARLV